MFSLLFVKFLNANSFSSDVVGSRDDTNSEAEVIELDRPNSVSRSAFRSKAKTKQVN